MELLKTVLKHRPVVLVQDVLPQMNAVLRIHTQDADVICAVVDPAESEAVRDFRSASLIPVRENVSCVQQRGVPQLAHGTATAIGAENEIPEPLLVQTLFHRSSSVGLEWDVETRINVRNLPPLRVSHQMKGQLSRRISDDVAGEHRVVGSGVHCYQVEERPTQLHRSSHGSIIRVLGIRSAVTIEELILRHIVPIIVGTIERGLDGERRTRLSQYRRPKDPFLLTPDWHPLPVEGQACIEHLGRHEAARGRSQALDMIEHGQPQLEVEIQAHGTSV